MSIAAVGGVFAFHAMKRLTTIAVVLNRSKENVSGK